MDRGSSAYRRSQMGSEDRVSRNRPSDEDVGTTIFLKEVFPVRWGKK